tara:strand:- start:180 stop:440 length:261 start_codon:yes stop_codon:yes gene_type:complete
MNKEIIEIKDFWHYNVHYKYKIEYVEEYSIRDSSAYGGMRYGGDYLILTITKTENQELVYELEPLRTLAECYHEKYMFLKNMRLEA